MIKEYLKIIRNFFALTGQVGFSEWFKFLFFGENTKHDQSLFSVNVKNLGGQKVWLREKSRVDRDVFKYVFFDKYHQPFSKMPENAVILDLGTNIGLTVAHYGFQFPKGKVIGFEMDQDNFKLAVKNVAAFSNCKIMNQAVWFEHGKVSYNPNVVEDAFSISTQNATESMIEVEAVSLNEIIAAHQLARVDYIKMDIEGAEKEVLRAADLTWMKS
jgi:FkbM family methyltransferase